MTERDLFRYILIYKLIKFSSFLHMSEEWISTIEELSQRAGIDGGSRQGTLLENGPGGFAFKLQLKQGLGKGAARSWR